MKFPDNFLWGAATSGPQSEGQMDKQKQNIFDYWYEKEPELFYDKVGPSITSKFYNTYREDIKMMKELGFNSFRTSIQWTRLIKNYETGEADEKAIAFYNEVIDECLRNDIIPIMNLHHFDMPIELLHTYGGWESRHVVDLFVKFASTCFSLFKDRVMYWTTFNEPMVIVDGGYLYQFHYPNIKDGKRAIQIMYHINLASAKAIVEYRKQCSTGKIGIILNVTPAYARSENIEDQKAKEFADLFFNKSFLDPAVLGKFPDKFIKILENDHVLWTAEDNDKDIFQNGKVDFLGMNYYTPRRVKAKECTIHCDVWMPDIYFDNYDKPGIKINPSKGWEIYPEAIYDFAMEIKNNYQNIPWYLSENGMGIKDEIALYKKGNQIEDDIRIEFISDHLEVLHRAIEQGANCFGYHMWTPIDCWSWKNAYRNRYGFISYELSTGKKTVKKSGYWFKKVIEANTLCIETEEVYE